MAEHERAKGAAMTLAMFGGKPAVDGGLRRFNTIGNKEMAAVTNAMRNGPLSGYLGGNPWGGVYVQRLERMWEQTFGVDHAIACNSATSGLLAAAACIDRGGPYKINVSPYTMSATAAAPLLMGFSPHFCDVDPSTFNLDPTLVGNGFHTVVTSLFGHPAELHELRKICDDAGTLLIEDNAQSPFAKENGRYAGTVGHIGVFSLNIHKHLQCGEGGVVVTNDRVLADNIRAFTNHGEMASQEAGLNLRMTEMTAAIALSQLNRADEIVGDRVHQARKIIGALDDIPWITIPAVRDGCSHSYYALALLYYEEALGLSREILIDALAAEGFPLCGGYVKPLYHLPAFSAYTSDCPVAEDLHNKTLAYFENCSWSPTDEQIGQFREACKKIEADVTRLRSAA
jgi:perosamine synthetase